MNKYHNEKKFFGGYLAKYLFLKECRIQHFDPTEEFFKLAGKLYSPIKSEEENETETEELVQEDDDLFY